MARRTREERDNRERRGCCLGGCLLWTVSLLAAAQVAAVIILREDPGEDRWETALLVYAPQLPFVVLPALASAWALLARRTSLLVTNLLVLGVALFVVADLQLPGPAPEVEADRTIRVLTWNLQARAFKIEQIRESIQQWDPDIVCTQETYHDSFADLLPGYQHRRGSDSRIFSRLPILDHRRVTIGTTPPRKAILCEIETPSGPLSVLALHLPRATERGGIPRELGALAEHVTGGMHVRAEKFGDLLEWLPEDRPLLVVGDMNTPPASRHYRDLARHLTDAFAARGTGFGYTWLWRSRWPMLRIDYIWCGGGVRPVTCFTGEAGLTDHRQLIADVLVPES